jgi:predicted MPP superfamily phosphohydrolase
MYLFPRICPALHLIFLMLSTAPAENETKVITRRQFLGKGILAGAGLLALVSYSTVIEPNHVVVNPQDIWLHRLPSAFDGFRIAQISDIHYEEFLGREHVTHVVNLINAVRPDLVVATGDFVTRPWGKRRQYHEGALKAEPCAKVLAQLRSKRGTIAVLGNHDHATDPDFVTHALASRGVRVLRNQAIPLEAGDSRLWIAGVDDAVEHAADLRGTMSQVPSSEACLLLVHEPDMADWVCEYPVDLQLSGHSHGGQVRVPFLGAPVLPESGRKYPLGHYQIKNLQLYTNPGVGVITLPVRFDCPPEITVFTLRSGKKT